MIGLANLLAFLGLLTALLVVWRQSRPGRLRLFALQSALLAALAVVIALFSGHHDLLGVAVAFAVIKVGVIPRVLARITLGTVRPVTPGRSMGMALLVAGALVVVPEPTSAAHLLVPAPVHTWCGIPTAQYRGPVDRGALQRAATQWKGGACL